MENSGKAFRQLTKELESDVSLYIRILSSEPDNLIWEGYVFTKGCWIHSKSEDNQCKKEQWIYVWDYKFLPRNVTDDEILTAYENGLSLESDDKVRRYTPDEFIAEINGETYPYGQVYARLIFS